MPEEKLFTIPLRREFLKVPKYKRTQKSMKAIKLYLQKHMKSDQIKIGEHLNNEIWKRGRKNPPSRIKIKAIKDDKNVIRAELPEFNIKFPVQEKDKKKKKEKEVKAEETKPEEEAKKKEVELKKEQKILEKETRKEEIKEDTTKEMTKEEETLMKEKGIIKESQKPHHQKGK